MSISVNMTLVATEAGPQVLRRTVFPGLAAVFAISMHELLFRLYYWVQGNWQERLQQSGSLAYWWLFTIIFVFSEWLVIMATLVWFAFKYLKVHFTPPFISVLMDFAVTVSFWCLSTILDDALLRQHLAGIGLRYLSGALFWVGGLWFLMGFVRLKVLSRTLPGQW